MTLTRVLTVALMLTASLYAGPPLACFPFEAEPNSLLSKIQPLSTVALDSDDRPDAARARVEQLRAAAKADNAASLAEAGYLIHALNQMWRRDDPDGLKFLRQAQALRPDNAEIHLLLALAYADRDVKLARQHAEWARQLSKPNSVVARNLAKAAQVLGWS